MSSLLHNVLQLNMRKINRCSICSLAIKPLQSGINFTVEMWISKFFYIAFLVWVSAEEEVLVDIPQGTLKGLKTTTVIGGKPYFSFKGIPYAKPNLGVDKFRVSQK